MSDFAPDKLQAVLERMREDINRYAATPGVNKKGVNIRIKRLNDLIDYSNDTEAYIEKLQDDVQAMTIKNFELQETIKKFEAICLLHGIDNFPTFTNLSVYDLVYQVIENDRRKRVKLPNRIVDEKFIYIDGKLEVKRKLKIDLDGKFLESRIPIDNDEFDEWIKDPINQVIFDSMDEKEFNKWVNDTGNREKMISLIKAESEIKKNIEDSYKQWANNYNNQH